MEASQKNGRVGFPGKNCARKPEEFPLLKWRSCPHSVFGSKDPRAKETIWASEGIWPAWIERLPRDTHKLTHECDCPLWQLKTRGREESKFTSLFFYKVCLKVTK
jgi:hypothetical protein